MSRADTSWPLSKVGRYREWLNALIKNIWYLFCKECTHWPFAIRYQPRCTIFNHVVVWTSTYLCLKEVNSFLVMTHSPFLFYSSSCDLRHSFPGTLTGLYRTVIANTAFQWVRNSRLRKMVHPTYTINAHLRTGNSCFFYKWWPENNGTQSTVPWF